MEKLYPLRFEPLLRRHLWGGRRLGTVLGKQLGPGNDYAESWEIVDHGSDQSIVAGGPFSGHALAEIVASHGVALFGRHHPLDSFPLLLKFLDARASLSVQVHPDDRQAAQLSPPDRGKTEAWYVLAAEPGSFIYAGLKRGFDRPAFEREVARGTCELCLHRFEPKPGDCVLVRAGTVHAIGAGVLLSEIQQSSDATFRLYDWNRQGPDGKPRPLHVEQALSAIDYRRGPVDPQVPVPTDRPCLERLVQCDKFVWDRWQLRGPLPLGGDNRFHLLTVIAGEIAIERDPLSQPLRMGQTVLLPASLPPTTLTPRGEATVLDAYLP